MILGMWDLPSPATGQHSAQLVLFWFSWICILAAIVCALRPWLQKQAHGVQELQHARTCLLYTSRCV